MSQDNPPIDKYFLPEWVTGVFYGKEWHPVKEGSFQEGRTPDGTEFATYLDPFNAEIVFVMEPITGYRIKKPEELPPPPPPEPQATVTELHPRK